MRSMLPTYLPRQSCWHQMDARCRLLGVAAALILLALIQSIPGALLTLALTLGSIGFAALPWSWWWDRLAGVGLFLLLVVILLPISVGPPTWDWGWVTISLQGTRLAVLILVKAFCAVLLALLLFGTAPVEATLHAAASLHTPRAIVQILHITWRYVRVMHHTVMDFSTALRLRGFRNRPGWRTYRTISRVVGTMLVLGFERSERVSQAMRCRGYSGKMASLEEYRIRGMDVLLLTALILVGAAGLGADSLF